MPVSCDTATGATGENDYVPKSAIEKSQMCTAAEAARNPFRSSVSFPKRRKPTNLNRWAVGKAEAKDLSSRGRERLALRGLRALDVHASCKDGPSWHLEILGEPRLV